MNLSRRELLASSALASAAMSLQAATAAQPNADARVLNAASGESLALASYVARTRRLLVVDEDYMSFGLSAELVVRVLDRVGLGGLDRYARHALPDVPIPAAVTLERAVVPNAESIAAAVRGLA